MTAPSDRIAWLMIGLVGSLLVWMIVYRVIEWWIG
jgi:hypothetical protein